MDIDDNKNGKEIDVMELLSSNVQLIEKSVTMKETRLLMGRTLR